MQNWWRDDSRSRSEVTNCKHCRSRVLYIHSVYLQYVNKLHNFWRRSLMQTERDDPCFPYRDWHFPDHAAKAAWKENLYIPVLVLWALCVDVCHNVGRQFNEHFNDIDDEEFKLDVHLISVWHGLWLTLLEFTPENNVCCNVWTSNTKTWFHNWHSTFNVATWTYFELVKVFWTCLKKNVACLVKYIPKFHRWKNVFLLKHLPKHRYKRC